MDAATAGRAATIADVTAAEEEAVAAPAGAAMDTVALYAEAVAAAGAGMAATPTLGVLACVAADAWPVDGAMPGTTPRAELTAADAPGTREIAPTAV